MFYYTQLTMAKRYNRKGISDVKMCTLYHGNNNVFGVNEIINYGMQMKNASGTCKTASISFISGSRSNQPRKLVKFVLLVFICAPSQFQ